MSTWHKEWAILLKVICLNVVIQHVLFSKLFFSVICANVTISAHEEEKWTDNNYPLSVLASVCCIWSAINGHSGRFIDIINIFWSIATNPVEWKIRYSLKRNCFSRIESLFNAFQLQLQLHLQRKCIAYSRTQSQITPIHCQWLTTFAEHSATPILFGFFLML